MKPNRFLLLIILMILINSSPVLAGIEDSIRLLNQKMLAESSSAKRVDLALSFIEKIQHNHPEATKTICFRVLPMARKLSNVQPLADLYHHLGVAHSQTGRNDSAFIYFHLAYDLAKRHQPLEEHYEILNRLGIFYLETKDLDSSKFYFLQTLKAARKSGREDELVGVYNNLGIIFHDLGELNKAYSYYLRAYEYYKKHKNEVLNRALTLNNLGLIQTELGNSEKAINLFEQSIQLHQQTNNLTDLASAYGNLAIVYKETQRLDSALHYQKMAWSVSDQIDDVFGQARALMNMGNIYQKQKRYSTALQSYQESMALCQKHSIHYGVLLNKINLGELMSEMGQYAGAIMHLNDAVDLAIQMKLKPVEIKVYMTLYRTYEKQGLYEKALYYHVKFQAMQDSLDQIARVEEIHKMEASVEAREQQIKNVHLQSQLEHKALRIRNQRIAGVAMLLLLLVSLAMLLLVIRSRVQLRKTNQLLNDLNQEIMLKNGELEAVSAAKDKLFSVVAHDLRTPFNGLLGILSVLTEEFDAFPEYKRRQVLLSSYQQAVTTFGLIENLLQWSMNQRGMIEVRPGYHDLYQIAEVELGVLKGRIERKRLQVTNKIESSSSMAWVDFDLVRIILRNTINNAIKFTPEGGKVEVASVKGIDYLSVTIKDTGIGMAPEMVQEVFKLSNRHHREGTDREKGSGLGLVIVHEFVQMLSARIEIKSEIGVGTVITMHFPIRPTSAEPL